MTPEQINIAIAEVCGWTHFENGPYDGKPFGIRPGDTAPSYKFLVPDFVNDLNAMHEAEKWLLSNFDASTWMRYDLLIDECCGGFSWHAKASERAEAFLRTLGKWTE